MSSIDIRMPDGQIVRFPDSLTDQQIRGLIMRRYPGAVRAMEALDEVDASGAAGRHVPDKPVTPVPGIHGTEAGLATEDAGDLQLGRLLSEIGGAKLMTALIKANGGKPLR